MEKRLILAITLSVSIILLFQYYFTPKKTVINYPAHEQDRAPTQAKKETIIKQAEDKKAKKEISETNILKEIATRIETDKFGFIFTNVGGALKDIYLKEYDSILVKNTPHTTSLFSISYANFAQATNTVIYNIQQTKDKVIYTYEDPQSKIRIKKEYLIYKSLDYIELKIYTENLSDSAKNIQYELIGPSQIEQTSKTNEGKIIEIDAFLDGKILRKNGVKNNFENFKGIISWVSLKNKYFTLAMKVPDDADGFFAKKLDNELFLTGITLKERILEPGKTIEDEYVIYIGPLVKSRLAALKMGFEETVYYGVFTPISMMLLTLLGWIYKVFHNWGVAVIVVTILINIILFPLTKKSFVSMQKMQELQPHMEKLRALHKDNPQKLNKEVMELYKQYNVNPFGGCLPMLMQLPIFVAFYQTLMRSIELKNAKFLWIKDLSRPDALFKFPSNLPLLGETFNLLPIITLIVMVIQQKMSVMASGSQASPEMAQQQKFMAIFFPIFFGIMLYNFPSGLVLYWLTNSLLMASEQWMLKKAHGKA